VNENPFDLTGKVSVVTGGNSGIGLAMARALADAGSAVSVWGRTAARNDAAVADLTSRGANAASVSVDVTQEDEVRAAVASVAADFGRIDACFANAGSLGVSTPSFLESTSEGWHASIASVLDSVYFTTREVARVMVAQGDGGSLVATSSISAYYGSAPGSHAYAVAKAGVTTLMRGLAVELARHRIRANTIVPGWVDGKMMETVRNNPTLGDRVLSRIPQRRWARPDEFGALAVYLAGSGSTWHTGDEFVLDGGYRVV
jgi:NAD(P)-dependent dehydrogenase (short-subunit alcohol dehydrogenase family)